MTTDDSDLLYAIEECWLADEDYFGPFPLEFKIVCRGWPHLSQAARKRLMQIVQAELISATGEPGP